MLLEGKSFLITGVLMDSSIAFHVAKIAQEQGAEVVLTVAVVLPRSTTHPGNSDYPLNLMPWIFLGLVALGMVWYAVIRQRKPEIVEEAGTFEEEPVPPHLRSAPTRTAQAGPAAGDPELRP